MSVCSDCIHRDNCTIIEKNLCYDNDYDKYTPETKYYDYINEDEDD